MSSCSAPHLILISLVIKVPPLNVPDAVDHKCLVPSAIVEVVASLSDYLVGNIYVIFFMIIIIILKDIVLVIADPPFLSDVYRSQEFNGCSGDHLVRGGSFGPIHLNSVWCFLIFYFCFFCALLFFYELVGGFFCFLIL